MASFGERLTEFPKEELVLVIQALAGADATTRDRVINLLDYIDEQHQSRTAKRRSSRPSTRASSETSQESAVHIHPSLREALKITARDIKICKMCNKAFEQKNNTNSSCHFHDGHWLIEVVDNGIEFVRASLASEDIKNDASLMWLMSCCSQTKENPGKGCVTRRHVAVDPAAKNQAVASSSKQ